MESIEFISKYERYLEEIQLVVKPELLPLIDELREVDPHDLVSPDTFFFNEIHARGYIWSLFIQKTNRISNSL